MEDWKDYFKNKKITVMGLGLLGRGVGDVKFLTEQEADLIVTDLKSEEQLEASLTELKNVLGDKYNKITFVLGEHRLEDFKNRDFILKAAGVPLDSPYILEARNNNIPVEMGAALFTSLTAATVVGITGTRGKSTVTHLLHDVLKEGYEKQGKGKVFLGGNVRGLSTLHLLKEAKKGDIAVLELDSWQLQGFGEKKISPHVAVFTTFLPDHMNYYKNDMDRYLDDKANIFRYQTENDIAVLGAQVSQIILSKYEIKSTFLTASVDDVSKEWKLLLPGDHNRYNAALAMKAAQALGVDIEVIRKVTESFKAVAGRLEFISEVRGVRIYNDNNATTPDATIVGLKAFGDKKNIILVMGGTDKGLDMSKLISEIKNHCKVVSFFRETGTDKIKDELFALEKEGIKVIETEDFSESVNKAFALAEKGDIFLFSPAFASFGRFFKNEFDRGDQFNALVKNFK